MAAKKKNQNALMDMMGEHAKGTSVVASNDGLALISTLAQAQYDAAMAVARAEDDLKEAKEILRRISEEDLPEAMKENGVKEFTTTDNLVIKLKEDVNVGITVENRPAAFAWLAKYKFDGLIKSNMNVTFDKSEAKAATKLAKDLKKEGYTIELNQSIHYQTLKAFVKERLADEDAKVPFPKELFGARTYQVAVVKPK